MPAGRPTDYSKETIAKSLDYLERYKEFGDVIPSIAGLSVVLGVARKTIYDWASQDEKKEFCNIVEKLLAHQEKQLVDNGLVGTYNSSITKLMLTKHGYSDKTETDITTKGESINLEAREKSKQAISSFLNDNTRDSSE